MSGRDYLTTLYARVWCLPDWHLTWCQARTSRQVLYLRHAPATAASMSMSANTAQPQQFSGAARPRIASRGIRIWAGATAQRMWTHHSGRSQTFASAL